MTGYSIEREVLIHHFSNVRFVNHLQVLATPLLIFLFLTGSRSAIRIAAFLVASLGIAILLFCSARAATGCLLIGFVLCLFLLRFDRDFVRASVLVLASGAFIFGLLFKLIPELVFETEVEELRVNLNSSGRWDLWVEAISLIRDNWLLGVGPQHYAVYSDYGFGHPHNLILQLALDYGVIIAGLLMAGLCLFGICTCKTISAPNAFGFEKACTWSLVSIFGTSLFSGVWVAPMTQLLVVLVAAPLVAILRHPAIKGDVNAVCYDQVMSKSYTSTRRELLLQRLIAVGVITMTCAMAWFVGAEVKQRIDAPVILGDAEIKVIHAPRFWQYQHWDLRPEGEQNK